MLEYFRNRMGVLLWIVLILVIGGFVFLGTGSGVSFDFSSSLYVVGNDTVTDRELKKFAKKHHATYLNTNIDGLKEDLNKALEDKNADKAISDQLQKDIEETQRKLDRMATFMAWQQQFKSDGVEVSKQQAVDYLKADPNEAWLSLKSDGGNLLEGLELSEQGHNLLESFSFRHSTNLHANLYKACVSIPTSLIYSGKNLPYGFRYDTIQVRADLVTLSVDHLDTLKVSYDDAQLKSFYNQYKNTEMSDYRLGYKKQSDYSLTCLVAVSQDFVQDVELDVISVRKYYETNKYSKWVINEEEELFTPFREVRDQVEFNYKLIEAQKLAKTFLYEAHQKWKEGISEHELRDSYNLQIHNYENVLEHDLSWIPDFEWAFSNTSQITAMANGDISDDVVLCGLGAAIYRMDNKNEAQAPEFATIKDQVIEDFLINKKLEKAEKLLGTFKNKWDETQDFRAAVDALTSDATKLPGISSFSDPDIISIGPIRPSDAPEPINAFPNQQQKLLKNVFRKSAFSASVERDLRGKRVLVTIARDHAFLPKNYDGEEFSQVYDSTYKRARSVLLRSFNGKYASRLFETFVRRLK